MGARITRKTQESYRARGMEAEWRHGIECPLALPRPCYELDLCWLMFSPRTSSSSVLPDNVSCEAGPGLGIECTLTLPHSPVISWTWY